MNGYSDSHVSLGLLIGCRISFPHFVPPHTPVLLCAVIPAASSICVCAAVKPFSMQSALVASRSRVDALLWCLFLQWEAKRIFIPGQRVLASRQNELRVVFSYRRGWKGGGTSWVCVCVLHHCSLWLCLCHSVVKYWGFVAIRSLIVPRVSSERACANLPITQRVFSLLCCCVTNPVSSHGITAYRLDSFPCKQCLSC